MKKQCWEKETLNPLEMQMAEGSALTKTNATRQSQRVKDQGLGAMKIADKATPMAQKKNPEGNRLTFKNSFAVSNNELMHRSKKMGVKINDEELQKFDLLKDLEVARANLNEQTNKLEVTPILEDDNNLPLEEIKFIEWQSDSFDEEEFHIVTSRKSRKKGKTNLPKKGERTKKKLFLMMRQTVLEKGYLDLALGTTLGKGLLGQKLNNDRGHLELQGVPKKRLGTDIKNCQKLMLTS
jgi:hypothetical protein